MRYHLITNKRGKVVHVAGATNKPLCAPDTKVAFVATLRGSDMRTCQVCAERQMNAQYAAAMKRRASMTLAEQLDDML